VASASSTGPPAGAVPTAHLRGVAVARTAAQRIAVPGEPTVDGRVVGTWRRAVARVTVAIEVDPWVAWTERRRAQVRRRAEQYAQHLGLALAEGPASAPTSP